MRTISTTSTLALLVLATGCGGGEPPAVSPPAPSATVAPPADSGPASTAVTPPAATEPTTEVAHRLVVEATACWFGGLWADALGEEGDMKRASDERRCRDVAQMAYGTDAKDRLEQIRAVEATAVGDIASKVELIAGGDKVDGPRKAKLAKLVIAIGDVQRELLMARRAADRVKVDEDTKDADKLSKDEQTAAPILRAHAAFDALMAFDAGDLAKEANAVAVLSVLERTNIARRLPRHLKLYAVGDAFKSLFGVEIPAGGVPDDPTKKLTPGTWSTYLVSAASAAGHAVPATAKDLKDRYALAWAGTQAGIADKLAADEAGVGDGTDLKKVVIVVKNRLMAEVSAEQNAHGPGAAHPKKGK
jgi:hypothetical protein